MKYFNFFNDVRSIFYLLYFENKVRYKRTLLGPFWKILAIIITISILSVVWSLIFNINLKEFLPRIFVNLNTWFFCISSLTLGSDLLDKRFRHIIQSYKINYRFIVLKQTFFSIYEYLIFFPFFLIISFVIGSLSFLNFIFFLFGLIIVTINMYSIIYIVSILSVRFRDIGMLIKTISGPLLLLTPVIWKKDQLGNFINYAYLNPFTSFIEIITYPILNYEINYSLYLICLIIGVINLKFTNYLNNKYKNQIVLWAN